jgi:hypothetical protein
MLSQTSAAVTVDDPITIGDHNTLVADVEAALDALNGAGLSAPVPAINHPIVWLLHPKASAFTFGTAPVTSAGFARLATGAPWGADGVYTPVLDSGTAGAATTNTANQLLINALYIFPAQDSCSVSRVEALIPILAYFSGSGGQLDKVELQVVKVTAAGVETAHATVGLNSTTGSVRAACDRRSLGQPVGHRVRRAPRGATQGLRPRRRFWHHELPGAAQRQGQGRSEHEPLVGAAPDRHHLRIVPAPSHRPPLPPYPGGRPRLEVPMRRFLPFLATALLAGSLAACVPAGTAPVLDLGPAPSLTPGQSLITIPWSWPAQGPPEGELAKLLGTFKSPAAIASHLQAAYPWQDDYDTSRFLTPAELVKQRRGVCTAFARFWTFALQAQGIRSDFIATWGPSSAHAYAIFRDPATSRWKLASNQYLYELDLGLERDGAIASAAAEFYGSGGWGESLIFDPDSGKVRQRMKNASAAPMAPLAPAVPGRNLFTVKR